MSISENISELREFTDRISGELTLLSQYSYDDQQLVGPLINWQTMLNDAIHELELMQIDTEQLSDQDAIHKREEAMDKRIEEIMEEYDFGAIRSTIEQLQDAYLHRVDMLNRMLTHSILQG